MRDPAQKTSLVFVFSSKSFFCDERKETIFFFFKKFFRFFEKKKEKKTKEKKNDTSKTKDVCLRTPKPTGNPFDENASSKARGRGGGGGGRGGGGGGRGPPRRGGFRSDGRFRWDIIFSFRFYLFLIT